MESKKPTEQKPPLGGIKVLKDNHEVPFIRSRSARREYFRRNKEKFGGRSWDEVKNQIK